jgi:hypothetical protein
MRKLLPVLLVLCSALGWAGTCGSGYSFVREIQLLSAANSNQTNYPYPVNLLYLPLRTVGNSGQVQHTVSNALSVTVPADLVFCPDTSLTSTPLKYETAAYNATTGALQAWVQIPTLHTGSTDSIYLYTNNSGVSTDQEDLTMWTDVNCIFVYHMEGTSKDSCNSHTGTDTNITYDTDSADYTKAANFNLGSSQIQLPSSAAWSPCYRIVQRVGYSGWNLNLYGHRIGGSKQQRNPHHDGKEQYQARHVLRQHR